MKHVLVLALFAAGCVVSPSEFNYGEREVEAGDDDDATLPPGEEDGIGPYGRLGIWYWEQPPSPGDVDYTSVSGFIADFVDEIDPGTAGTGGVDFNGPDGLDDCAITIWDAADTVVSGGTPSVTVDLEAGDITLTSPTWTEVIAPGTGNAAMQYVLEIEPELEVHFDTPYIVSSTGGTFPAFGFTSSLVLQEPIHLLAPAPAVFFEAGPVDLEIEWEGGEAAEPIHLELQTSLELTTGNSLIQCSLTNDGEFVIPGGLLAQFPSGQQVRLLLSQNIDVVEDVDGYPVTLQASTSAQSLGATP
jgi:hypothetical protein